MNENQEDWTDSKWKIRGWTERRRRAFRSGEDVFRQARKKIEGVHGVRRNFLTKHGGKQAGGMNAGPVGKSNRDQADKSARGMPWHQEPKKDVTSCDKLRGAANKLRSGDFRMGKPGRAILCQRMVNQIAIRGEPPELKHLSRARKRNQPRFRQ